jgi:hypothetical protein
MPVDAASSAYGPLMLRSQQDPHAFWREQASRIHWHAISIRSWTTAVRRLPAGSPAG